MSNTKEVFNTYSEIDIIYGRRPTNNEVLYALTEGVPPDWAPLVLDTADPQKIAKIRSAIIKRSFDGQYLD